MLKSMGKLFSKRKSSKHRGKLSTEVSETTGHGSGMKQMMNSEDCQIHNEAVVSLYPIQPGLCLSGSKDKTVVLYDFHNHKLEDRWTGHEREVTKVLYGRMCHGIFSASRDKSVKMWNRGHAHCVKEYLGHDLVVSGIDLNHDNTWLCTGSRDNYVKIWDVETAQCVMENLIHRNLVTDVKFVPMSHLLVQTGEDKEVRLFDTRTLQVVHSFPRKHYIQMACDVTSDGIHCITCSNGFGGNGCEATLWDIRSKSIVHEFRGHSEAVEACTVLPFTDRQLIATSSRDCSVKIWDMNTKECLCQCFIAGSGPLTSVICYQDSSLCVSSFNSGVLTLQLSLSNLTLQQTGQF